LLTGILDTNRQLLLNISPLVLSVSQRVMTCGAVWQKRNQAALRGKLM